MERQETLREIAALRHNLHVNNRLRLEFLASISKLLRDYGIKADDELLSSLILAVPDELWAKTGEPVPPVSPTEEPGVPPLSPGESPVPPVAPDYGEPVPPVAPESEPVPPVAPE